MVNLLGVSLTREQEEILASCPPPTAKEGTKGQLARITAAAGTGKTTTLLALALKGAELGHTSITYITFNTAAVNDASSRLQQAMQEANMGHVSVSAKTIHGCALGALLRHLGGDGMGNLWDEKRVKKWVAYACKGDIDSFCRECFVAIDCNPKASQLVKEHDKERARGLVAFFIFKTLVHFCQNNMTLQQFEDPSLFGRDYYPAKLFHRETQHGFDEKVYNNATRRRFYVDQAIRLWDLVVKERINSFDFVMKQAHLLGLRIPGTLLLVDESQDMDGCQVEWTAKRQVGFGTQVYVVGDAAQTIYGFRGANSKHLMDLPVDRDCFLTASWRFGASIARAANCVLFSKHKSAQSKMDKNGRCTSWNPYRVQVGAPKSDRVTSGSLLPKWKELDQLTLIAWSNMTLMAKVLGLFIERRPRADDAAPLVTQEARDLSNEFPKIHVNGGKKSGLTTWERIMEEVGGVYHLYAASKTGENGSLSPTLFPEFKGREISWAAFLDDCVVRELTKYQQTIKFVFQFEEQALSAAKVFKTNVIDMKYTAAEADIILTTCHAAKGMEWDIVELCDDFENLCQYNYAQGVQGVEIVWRSQGRRSPKWQFGFRGWGDDVNLLYVACTRAKRQLSLPTCSIVALLKDFDLIHMWKSAREVRPSFDEELKLEGVERCLDAFAAEDLYEDLVAPLREECNLEPGQFLGDTLTNNVGPGAMGDQEQQQQDSDAALVTPDTPAKRARSDPESEEHASARQKNELECALI